MNFDKLEHDHQEIFACIGALRKLIVTGIAGNAAAIAGLVVTMSSSIKLHLAVEDRVVYPALAASNNARVAELGRSYQREMGDLAGKYMAFAGRWNTAPNIAERPALFKDEANTVFKALYERTLREERELYPAFAAL